MSGEVGCGRRRLQAWAGYTSHPSDPRPDSSRKRRRPEMRSFFFQASGYQRRSACGSVERAKCRWVSLFAPVNAARRRQFRFEPSVECFASAVTRSNAMMRYSALIDPDAEWGRRRGADSRSGRAGRQVYSATTLMSNAAREVATTVGARCRACVRMPTTGCCAFRYAAVCRHEAPMLRRRQPERCQYGREGRTREPAIVSTGYRSRQVREQVAAGLQRRHATDAENNAAVYGSLPVVSARQRLALRFDRSISGRSLSVRRRLRPTPVFNSMKVRNREAFVRGFEPPKPASPDDTPAAAKVRSPPRFRDASRPSMPSVAKLPPALQRHRWYEGWVCRCGMECSQHSAVEKIGTSNAGRPTSRMRA